MGKVKGQRSKVKGQRGNARLCKNMATSCWQEAGCNRYPVGTCVSHVHGRAKARPYTRARLFAQSEAPREPTITLSLAKQQFLLASLLHLGCLSCIMTAVSITYILQAPEGFGLATSISYPVGALAAVLALAYFMYVKFAPLALEPGLAARGPKPPSQLC